MHHRSGLGGTDQMLGCMLEMHASIDWMASRSVMKSCRWTGGKKERLHLHQCMARQEVIAPSRWGRLHVRIPPNHTHTHTHTHMRGVMAFSFVERAIQRTGCQSVTGHTPSDAHLMWSHSNMATPHLQLEMEMRSRCVFDGGNVNVREPVCGSAGSPGSRTRARATRKSRSKKIIKKQRNGREPDRFRHIGCTTRGAWCIAPGRPAPWKQRHHILISAEWLMEALTTSRFTCWAP